MDIREFTNPEIDKSGWGDGPWQNEPDKIHWIDPATDLDILMVRHPEAGHWCGYVGVTEGHPAFEAGYYSSDENGKTVDLDVHGGVTYAAFCQEGEDPAVGICHVPFPGRPDHVWWIGFDFSHMHDISPGREMRDRQRYERALAEDDMESADIWNPDKPWKRQEVYRDRDYVENECREAAKQLKEMAVSGTCS